MSHFYLQGFHDVDNLMTKIIYGFQKKKVHIVSMREILLLQTLPNTTNLCFIKIKMYLLIL